MSAGHLTATATLFMRSAIYQQRTSSGEMQLRFPLLERRGMGTQKITGLWTGPQADAFFKTHGITIKAGQALQFEFERLFCLNNELHGIVASATLAPARWADKPADAVAAPAASPQPDVEKYDLDKAAYPQRPPRRSSPSAEAITCSADARQ